MTIRVIRVLEYRYVDLDRMRTDMANWHLSCQGIKTYEGMSIQSAVMMPEESEDGLETDPRDGQIENIGELLYRAWVQQQDPAIQRGYPQWRTLSEPFKERWFLMARSVADSGLIQIVGPR